MAATENLWLCVDPGETTGWSIWRGKEPIIRGQLAMWEFIDAVDEWLTTGMCGTLIESTGEDLPEGALGAIVCEDWKIYEWMLEKLAWDSCRTARAIGALTLLARQHAIPFHLQGADIKPAAVAAGAEDLYVHPLEENRHANDSIQHGVFYTARHGKAPA
jgi:hypothetical protein